MELTSQNCSVFRQTALMQSIRSSVITHGIYANTQQIEYMVGLEMARIKQNWLQAEEEYVEQLVLENPITVEIRPNNKQQPQKEDEAFGDTEIIDVVSVTTETESDRKQQRADACRRSRYKNKIRKAKSKYRHQYMAQKLQSSIEMFDNIQDVVACAERHLLTRGYSKESLQNLRNAFRVDILSG